MAKIKLKNYLEIMRPINCVMGGFTVFIGLLISHPEPDFLSFIQNSVNIFLIIAGFLIFFLVAGGTNAINDYFDYEIDKINRPNRPIPRGDITLKQSLQYYVFLNVIALILAIIIGFITVNGILIPLIVLFFQFIGYLYAWKAKASGLPGNIIVGVTSAVGFPFAALFINKIQEIPSLIWAIYIAASIFQTSREFVKGMQDVEGDKKFKIKTIANLHGYKTATIFMVTFSSIGAILFTLMIFFFGLNIFHIIFIIIADAIVVTLNILLISNPIDPKKQKISSLLIKIAGAILILAFLFGYFL
ncbi:UbiA family prenyltransferase [Promethearchaeum syntrophicum]|uniref:UbiA family prenyltransferase n=1 Tax=Promethearchaeum syntrophicum TaxID=2594042 RepID=A0A5B9D8M2_9ARCH|nr:UbiA family prenyltransferase [Candidatus Prometheoarchaeum syntrophicum]QEE14966.1 Digeranylgeranylglyceryl phosphate synthase [Candidatus Prometheoarchaeum syntrophicum]